MDEAPENASSDIVPVTITYTTASGWTEPDVCQWECNQGYEQQEDVCRLLYFVITEDSDLYIGYWDDPSDLMITDIVLYPGMSKGEYSFTTNGNMGDTITLSKNDQVVSSIGYNWQQTISYDNPAVHEFGDYLSISIGRKENMGTSNQYLLPNIFNSDNELQIICP